MRGVGATTADAGGLATGRGGRGLALLLAGWVASRAAVLAFTFLVVARGPVDPTRDLDLFASWVARIRDAGHWPYRDWAWEYPPGALPVFLLTGIAGTARPAYAVAFLAVVLAADLGVLAVLVAADRRGPRSLLGPATWCAGVPLLGPAALLRYDMVPTLAAVAGVLALVAGRLGRGGLLLAAGAALKLWPAVLAVAGLHRAAAANRRLAVGLLAPALAVLAAGLWLAPWSGLLGPVTYQRQRGVQVESLAALPLLWARTLGAGGYQVRFTFGALEVHGPGAAVLAVLATAGLVAVLAAAGYAGWRAAREGWSGPQRAALALAVVLGLLLTDKVLSPQYLLWALGLGAAYLAVADHPPRPVPVLLLAACLATQVVFPFRYNELLGGGVLPLLVLTLRDALLAGALAAVLPLLGRRPVRR